MAPRFHPLRLASVRRDTADAVVLGFDVPPALRESFAFVPGQHLTLRTGIGGAEVRRSYSICVPAGSERLEVAVKRVPGGVFSAHAQDLVPGTMLDVMPPQGRFAAPVGGRHDYLLIAAGSGITPVVSIAESTLAGEPESTVTLVYGNRDSASILFRDRLDDLKDRYLTRFRLIHVLSREAQDVALFHGRIDGPRLDALAAHGLIEPAAADAVYICGPLAMAETARAALTAQGVAPERVHVELFTPAEGATGPAPRAADPAAAGTAAAEIEVILDGARRRFPAEPGESPIAAAARAGIDLPWSCANGMCATCRCKLVEGAASMVQNYALEPWETEAGYMLACQTRPTTPRIVLDFDAV